MVTLYQSESGRIQSVQMLRTKTRILANGCYWNYTLHTHVNQLPFLSVAQSGEFLVGWALCFRVFVLNFLRLLCNMCAGLLYLEWPIFVV